MVWRRDGSYGFYKRKGKRESGLINTEDMPISNKSPTKRTAFYMHLSGQTNAHIDLPSSTCCMKILAMEVGTLKAKLLCIKKSFGFSFHKQIVANKLGSRPTLHKRVKRIAQLNTMPSRSYAFTGCQDNLFVTRSLTYHFSIH